MRQQKMNRASYLWGIDLGGTKVEGVILGPGGIDEIVFRHRIPTGAELGYDHIVNQVKTLVDAMEQKVGSRPKRIGIGTPGTLNPLTRTMHGCNSECLNGRRLKEDLAMALRMDVSVANDANCFALAETRLGVVKQSYPAAQVVFGVIMGTGVGGGLVVNGKGIQGLHGIGGEWGHNYLDDSGGPCYCGKSGCVEKIISGPALEQYYYDLSGIKLSLPEITQRALKSEEDAMKTMQRLTSFFGKAISVIVNVIDPDVIVIGGGVGRIPELYTEGKQALGKYIFNKGTVHTPIVAPFLGDSAGVFGAAYLTADID